MEKQTQHLLKHFSSILRNKVTGKELSSEIDKTVVRYLSRKDLIEIIKKRFGGTVPKGHNLMELENEELLSLIENEMYIISYMTEKWCDESFKTTEKNNSSNTRQTQKPKPDDKKDKTSA